ncbi:MAG: carboxypeptidase-like regulatory domain-containing protein [Bacteroidota bacterium]
MKIIIFLLLTVPLYSGIKAQRAVTDRTIKGLIVSAEDKLPVNGANIEIKRKNLKAITDKQGSFVIHGADFHDTLIVSHTGYEIQKIVITNK